MLASWHRFGFVMKAFNSCAPMLRRSAQQFHAQSPGAAVD
jgi:hypothetical protein